LVARLGLVDARTALAVESVFCGRVGATGERTLLLWRSRPAVVIGRHQNPWLECRTDLLAGLGTDMVRRRSGGGAVYHDEGNLNFSLISRREEHDPAAGRRLLRDALGRLGVESEWDGRGGLLVAGRKVSGSAFRLTREIGVHHGTCLVKADLNEMERLLQGALSGIDTRAVRSHSTPTMNLVEAVRGISTADVEEAFIAEFGGWSDSAVEEADLPGDDELEDERRRLQDWDWIYGGSPPFQIGVKRTDGSGFVLKVKAGRVAEVSIFRRGAAREEQLAWLQGVRFTRRELSARLAAEGGEAEGAESLREWLDAHAW